MLTCRPGLLIICALLVSACATPETIVRTEFIVPDVPEELHTPVRVPDREVAG